MVKGTICIFDSRPNRFLIFHHNVSSCMNNSSYFTSRLNKSGLDRNLLEKKKRWNWWLPENRKINELFTTYSKLFTHLPGLSANFATFCSCFWMFSLFRSRNHFRSFLLCCNLVQGHRQYVVLWTQHWEAESDQARLCEQKYYSYENVELNLSWQLGFIILKWK